MKKELVISVTASDVTIALLEDKQVVELNTEKKDNQFGVGDIYLGRIRRTVPGLNAAFVDIGSEKDAFLHYLDLGPKLKSLLKYCRLGTSGQLQNNMLDNFTLEPEIEKTGKITEVLKANQWIPVQIAKEPISTKGPRISSELAIAGRYLVLVPFSEEVSISQKIKTNEERTRLKRLLASIKPKNFGVIIRTVAEGKKVAELDADLQELMGRWKSLSAQITDAKPPQKLLGELNRTSAILRDILSDSFHNIHVNDPALYEEVLGYLRTIAPDKQDIVKLYKGKVSIFEHFGIDRQMKSLFGKTVSLPGGAYLIVEHTEAMHVIDVNSGLRIKNEDNQEATALQVNLDAAREIARQLRLRDMGGIIVIDFIDLHTTLNRKTLFDTLRDEMQKDRARHTILPPSKFGLVQITRQRVRPETNIINTEKCPACDGTGEVKPSILLADEIHNTLNYLIKEQNEKGLVVHVNPYVAAYLKQGLLSIRNKWSLEYKQRIKIVSQSSYHFLEAHYFNKSGEEIKI